jgi:hypothetical protein
VPPNASIPLHDRSGIRSDFTAATASVLPPERPLLPADASTVGIPGIFVTGSYLGGEGCVSCTQLGFEE